MNRTDHFLICDSRIIHFYLSSFSLSEIVGICLEEDKFQSLGFSSEEDAERFAQLVGSSSVAFDRFRGFIIFFSSSIDSGSSSIASTVPETYLL